VLRRRTNWTRRSTWPINSEREYLRRNPLRWVALVTATSVCLSLWDIAAGLQFKWKELATIAVGVSFLLCFVQKRRAAWLITVIIYACLPLLSAKENIDFFTSNSSPHSWGVRLLAFGLWGAWLAYLFYIQKPYYQYVEQEWRQHHE
jgi:hypothetical protein